MKTSPLSPEIRERLAHFASGNATPDESARVQETLKDSEEARRELDRLNAVWSRLDTWDVPVSDSVFQPMRLRRAAESAKRSQMPFWARVVQALRFPEMLPAPAWGAAAAAACMIAFVAVQFGPMDSLTGSRTDSEPLQVAAATPSPAAGTPAVASLSAEERDRMAEAMFRELLESPDRESSRTLTGLGIRVNLDSDMSRRPSLGSSFAPNGTSLPGNVDLALYSGGL